MKIKVIYDGYYVWNDLTNLGLINKYEFELSFTHTLVVGDIWESKTDENGFNYYECIEGKWKGDENDGWWEYEDNEYHFEVI
jgi:hypothetical protein